MSRPAVFLDRDGTLIEERGSLDRLDLVTVFPWTADALRLLNRAGYATVVVTNQSAVGRGIIDEAFVASVHDELDRRFALGGARIDRYYFCPHRPDADLEQYRQVTRCRSRAGHDRWPAGSGSRRRTFNDGVVRDVACGHTAGARSVLVRTGHGAREAGSPPEGASADAILNNLMEATAWILRSSSR
jgi:D-glycero-D-manno-heptose 1,7-bisphosphate phosphatase